MDRDPRSLHRGAARRSPTGKDADDGSEVTSADFGYPLPSASPTTMPPYPKPATAAMPDGPQWVLEHWSNEHNVFQFIRVEDIAYDRRPGMSKVVYLADTGEPRAKPSAIAGWTRLERSATGGGPYMNGRIFKLTLGSNPLEGATLDILPGANFDALGYNSTAAVHQPDNLETTTEGLYIQEDTGSHNAQSAAFPDATNARIWRYPFSTGVEQVVAEVNQAIPGAPTFEPRRVGVERHRRRLGGVRPWRVPRGRPGARLGYGDPRWQRSAGDPEARERTAAAAASSGLVS